MDDKRYRIVLKPETLSQLAEVQASITKMASVLQPSILHMVEDQRRLNEIIRTAVEPINAHLLSVSAALSASTAFQNQIVENNSIRNILILIWRIRKTGMMKK